MESELVEKILGKAKEKQEVCCDIRHTGCAINDYEFDTIQSITRKESGTQRK